MIEVEVANFISSFAGDGDGESANGKQRIVFRRVTIWRGIVRLDFLPPFSPSLTCDAPVILSPFYFRITRIATTIY
jgi:hypothetical protein